MSNTISNLAVDQGFRAAASWCQKQLELGQDLASYFLYLALLVALVETGLILYAKYVGLKNGQPISNLEALTVDPGALAKLIEALKGLLETLKGLPAWVAIFLAGLALLWIAGQRPEACILPPPVGASSAGAPKDTGTGRAKVQMEQPTNTQAPTK